MKDNKFSDQELEVAANTDIASLAESLGYTVDRKNRWSIIKEAQEQLRFRLIGGLELPETIKGKLR